MVQYLNRIFFLHICILISCETEIEAIHCSHSLSSEGLLIQDKISDGVFETNKHYYGMQKTNISSYLHQLPHYSRAVRF